MKKLKVLVVFALVLIVINILFMPDSFYRGDSTAIKFSAINLVKNSQFGISPERKNDLEGLLEKKGQYYHENTSNGLYYARWGFFNTLISAIPEIFVSHSEEKLLITQDSMLAHNIFNVVLASSAGVLLFLIVSFYSSSVGANIIFVLSTLYCTYLFNYLRIQSYEIQQIFLLLLSFYGAIQYRVQRLKRWLVLIYFSLFALVLLKDFYFLFVPPFFFYLFDLDVRKYRVSFLLKSFLAVSLPVGIILLSNKWQFQQYFFTNKASHIPYDMSLHAFSLKYFPDRVYDHLLNLQASVFIYCPLLLFAILGLKSFYQKYKRDFIFISTLSFLVSFPILFYYSFGEWCYGPRLIVIVIPLLVLPSIFYVEKIFEVGELRGKKMMYALILAFVCLTSLKFQLEYNSRPFFFKYDLQGRFDQFNNADVNRYFNEVPLFIIIQELNAYARNADAFYPLEIVLQNAKDEEAKKYILKSFNAYIRAWGPCNYSFDSVCKLVILRKI